MHTSAAVETLLGASVSEPTNPRATSQGSNRQADTFERVWTANPEKNDSVVRDFCSWSALLLHLMVHKAFCVLYNPLVRDPTMISDARLRTRFVSTFQNPVAIVGLTRLYSAIKHAQAFLQVFIRVCDDPVSEPFHWMYPGTYQPLQAISLLLADLLQHPWSDEATLSRGLVDAIFEMYQVDEGIVSSTDPPRRRLSASGKDAWSMLARTRKKALEQVGQDPHVLFPQRLASSDLCLCGERIAGRNPHADGGNGQRHSRSSHGQFAGAAATPLTTYSLPNGEHAPMTAHNDLIDGVDFDWQEWDASLGLSIGPMS